MSLLCYKSVVSSTSSDGVQDEDAIVSTEAETPLFSQTITIPMSAGDTPEIRDAWPRVVGRIFANF
jgi:hypothetical protein